jgi:hypothetical protein
MTSQRSYYVRLKKIHCVGAQKTKQSLLCKIEKNTLCRSLKNIGNREALNKTSNIFSNEITKNRLFLLYKKQNFEFVMSNILGKNI